MSESSPSQLVAPVLRLDGIPTPISAGIEGEGFILDAMGGWRPLVDDCLYAIEAECVGVHSDLAASLFGTIGRFHAMLPTVPPILAEAGLNSESPLSREDFEMLLAHLATFPDLNRWLYLYDCRTLVSAIQECTKEVCLLTGEFYRILNLEPFLTPGVRLDDGLRWSTSPTVTNLTAMLGFIFIRLHSLLDYTAKLAREAEGLRCDFKSYPKLSSSGFLFGNRSKLRMNKADGSLFEPCEEIAEIELLRNVVIHDGLLDDMPKAYEVIKHGRAIERYLLLPDRVNGQYERFKNRHRFYGREDKINLRLPLLIRAFQGRQVVSLKLIRAALAAGRTSAIS